MTVTTFDTGERSVTRILAFVRFTRAHGFRVGVQEELDALDIAGEVNTMYPERLRAAWRSLLCSSAEDWYRFDELFNAYWGTPDRTRLQRSGYAPRSDVSAGTGGWTFDGGQAAEIDQARGGDDADAASGGARKGASANEVSTRTDFRFLTDEEQLRCMERMVEQLARRMKRRLVRRQRLQRLGRRIHLRRTIRNNLRYGGTPLDLAFRRRRRELPRLVLLLDVSRSMSLYSLLFLRFARGVVGVFRDADAFVFHTRLVHVTDALREQDIYKVKEKLALVSLGWSGGTRIGECLQVFNRDYMRQMVNAHSVVIVVSDGYDTGPPELLETQLEQLQRRARRIVWLNPLLGREGYTPIARGMQSALPYLDLFAPAHDLASLGALESWLVRL